MAYTSKLINLNVNHSKQNSKCPQTIYGLNPPSPDDKNVLPTSHNVMKGEAGLTYQLYIYNKHKVNCWTQATHCRLLPIGHMKTLHYFYFYAYNEKT